MSVETPDYKIVSKDKDFEIRDYEGYIMAHVEVTGEYDRALYEGFMALFNYIQGNNTKRSQIPMTAPVTQEYVREPEKISMTAPVTAEQVYKNDYVVSFIMPRQYDLDTLPVPENKNITFEKVGPFRAAVIRFSGKLREGKAMDKIDDLKKWMDKKGLSPKSNFMMAQYDPPFLPGFLRRNEVIVKI